MESAWTKRKSAAPAKWLVQRFAFCTLGSACPLYLCFSLPLLKGKAIVVPGKATPIHFSITPHRLPFGGAGTFPHSRRGLHRAKCSWRPLLGLPPCVTAFRLVFRSFLFDGKELSAFYHTPPPIKNQEVWARFVDTHKFIGFFRVFLTEKAHA